MSSMLEQEAPPTDPYGLLDAEAAAEARRLDSERVDTPAPTQPQLPPPEAPAAPAPDLIGRAWPLRPERRRGYCFLMVLGSFVAACFLTSELAGRSGSIPALVVIGLTGFALADTRMLRDAAGRGSFTRLVVLVGVISAPIIGVLWAVVFAIRLFI
jgi:hypothetical protein